MNVYNVANHIDYMQRLAMPRKQMAINNREDATTSFCERSTRKTLALHAAILTLIIAPPIVMLFSSIKC
jgi:hypothetical protein